MLAVYNAIFLNSNEIDNVHQQYEKTTQRKTAVHTQFNFFFSFQTEFDLGNKKQEKTLHNHNHHQKIYYNRINFLVKEWEQQIRPYNVYIDAERIKWNAMHTYQDKHIFSVDAECFLLCLYLPYRK